MNVPDAPIPEWECWQLLASVSVGRVALPVKALPAILPVQYYLAGRALAVCLGHRELPQSSLDGAMVAFNADAIDPVTRSGWSVQVQGRSVLTRQPELEAECSWPTTGQVVRIEPAARQQAPR